MACVAENHKTTLQKVQMYITLWELQKKLGHISFRESDSYANQGHIFYLYVCFSEKTLC